MNKIYVLMHRDEIFENRFYTEEDVVSKRVENLNNGNPLGPYWYQTLYK